MTDTAQAFQHLRHVDFDHLASLPADQRWSQKLIDATNGGRAMSVAYIRTPPGSGSPEGLHTHAWEQIFYVLEGTMNIEVEGEEFLAPPGSLVVFPVGVRHRNWNDSDVATVHLAINSPLPPPKNRPATTDQPR